MGHSQSSAFPLYAAITNSTGIKGAVFLETSNAPRCTLFTDQEIAKLATVPILFEFNDHLDQQPAGVLASFNNCKALVDKINAAGGDATMLHPVELGIHGNSHMVMLDKNNLQIADLILRRGPITAEIGILAVIISWLVGLPVGILSAIRPNGWADGIARTLLDGPAGRDDRVAQYLRNGPEYLEVSHAALKIGIPAVNTNYRYRGGELRYLWEDAEDAYVPGGLDVLTLREGRVAEVVAFLSADFTRFGPPARLRP